MPKLYSNQSKFIKLYSFYDHSFIIPKVNIYFKIYFENLHNNLIDYFTILVFKNYLSFRIDENLNEAYEAGNTVRVSLDEK